MALRKISLKEMAEGPERGVLWQGEGVSLVGDPKLHELGSLGLHPLILAISLTS